MSLADQFNKLAEYMGEQFEQHSGHALDLIGLKLAEFKAEKTQFMLDVAERLAGVRDGKDGAQGPQGERGADGIDGKDGAQGERGEPGKDGADGQDGQPGADGKDGLQGMRGDPGPPGSNGFPGEPGKDGIDGRDGAPGADGRDGEPGPQGERGLPGYDGTCIEFLDLWKASTEYRPGDVVVEGGSCWIAARRTFEEQPSREPDADNRAWRLVAQRGAKGDKGIPGPMGKQGPQGPPAPGIVDLRLSETELIVALEDGAILRAPLTDDFFTKLAGRAAMMARQMMQGGGGDNG